jgi:hypothetical protein
MKTTETVLIFGPRGDLSKMNPLFLVVMDGAARRQWEEPMPVKAL